MGKTLEAPGFSTAERDFSQVDKCRAVYDRILDLRIATPQIVVNFSSFLEEHNYFEHAFKVP